MGNKRSPPTGMCGQIKTGRAVQTKKRKGEGTGDGSRGNRISRDLLSRVKQK